MSPVQLLIVLAFLILSALLLGRVTLDRVRLARDRFMGLPVSEGRLLEANQTALTFGGFAREEVVGRSFWETGWWSTQAERREQLHVQERHEPLNWPCNLNSI
jgi:PAS domain-containing protein